MDLQRGLALEQGVCFKYLGIVFHSSICLAGCVAAALALLTHKAMHDCRARCAVLSIEAAPVQLQLFSTMVEFVLSHGAGVWGMQLAAQAAASRLAGRQQVALLCAAGVGPGPCAPCTGQASALLKRRCGGGGSS